ncbi:MAG: hypothetical protein JNJ57_16665 [Saprospiraceae bacterium]|nr:hypothetical protein [Saprospiraceae bacterium]
MKKYFLAILAFATIFFSFCTKTNDQVLIRFTNSTPDDFVNALYDFDENHQYPVGNIPAGATSDYFEFDYFEVGAELPMGFLRAEGTEGTIEAWSGLWCGTGVEFKQLEPGKYTIEISKHEFDQGIFYQILFVE